MYRSPSILGGGAAGAADLGSSSKYSSLKHILNAEVDEVSWATVVVPGLAGILSQMRTLITKWLVGVPLRTPLDRPHLAKGKQANIPALILVAGGQP